MCLHLLKQMLVAKEVSLMEGGPFVLGKESLEIDQQQKRFLVWSGHWRRREVEEKQHLWNPVGQGLNLSLIAL